MTDKIAVSDFLIFDGHNDALGRLYLDKAGKRPSFMERGDTGHLDLPRARDGGFGGGFFAIMAPPEESRSGLEAAIAGPKGYMGTPVTFERAQEVAMRATAGLFRLEDESSGQIKVIRTADELTACLEGGVLAVALHFEGAEAIGPDLSALDVYYRAGLRSLGLVWSRPNIFAHGVPFKVPHSPDTGPGLTDVGRELVQACNRLGIMIDLSHLNEAGFWDVAKMTQAPLVATHSNAHAICPATRNLTDKQLDAIRESDGMVGVNFAVGFLREDGSHKADTPIATIVQHVDYLVQRLGIDRVGFGSDFDGATVPAELGDVAGLPKLIAALREAGYDDESLKKLTHSNWVRVLGKTWHNPADVV